MGCTNQNYWSETSFQLEPPENQLPWELYLLVRMLVRHLFWGSTSWPSASRPQGWWHKPWCLCAEAGTEVVLLEHLGGWAWFSLSFWRSTLTKFPIGVIVDSDLEWMDPKSCCKNFGIWMREIMELLSLFPCYPPWCYTQTCTHWLWKFWGNQASICLCLSWVLDSPTSVPGTW